MLRSIKLIILATSLIFIISLILPGCYTQLSRPNVDTEDEYYTRSEQEAVAEYDQDEGVPSQTDDSRDIYIYNYYPYWNDFYDFYYSPYWRGYNWNYLGPYPYYWWDPYGHWWMPGWYIGFSYYDYGWGRYPWYYDNYYRHGDYSWGSKRSYVKQPFSRRSPRLVDRRERAVDNQTSLARPQNPTRVERPKTTLSNPTVRDKATMPQRERRSIQEPAIRTKPDIQPPRKQRDDAQPITKPRSVERKSDVMGPRAPKSSSPSKMIDTAPPPKVKDSSPNRSYSPPQRSDRNSTPSTPQLSKPSSPSYTPRSSGTSSGTPSTPRSSSSSPSRSSSSSSGSSKTKK